jgi:uncharacterized membrane protein
MVGFGLFGEQAVSSSSVRVSSSGFRFMVFSFVSYCRDTPCGYPLSISVFINLVQYQIYTYHYENEYL